MSNDVLSDVLNLVRLSGALIFRIDMCGAWCIAANPTVETFAPLLPEQADHLIAFHVVLAGDCWLCGPDGDWFMAPPGDAVVLPHGDAHVLGNQARQDAIPLQQLLDRHQPANLRHLQVGTGDHPHISLLCGFLSCDRRAFESLFASLPGLFRVPLGTQAVAWVDDVLGQVMDDMPGALIIRTRLTEVLFMQALRTYVDMLPDDACGWLAAVRDPVVGRALHLLHSQPCRAWSVQTLATQAASSRSRLASRFREVLGQTPMHYLAQLRMQMAARRLHQGTRTMAAVADEVGYDSAAAFQRAFKRHFGIAPGFWRQKTRPCDPGSTSAHECPLRPPASPLLSCRDDRPGRHGTSPPGGLPTPLRHSFPSPPTSH